MTKKEIDSLVIRYLNGDIEAFNDLYQETKKTVYLSIWTVVRNNTVCEDLMQDTYLKMINSLNYYEIGTNFSAWISKLAHNIAINYYQKNKRINLLDEDNSPEIIDESSNSPILNKALDILEGNERAIIIYHIILNYTFKDIGNILNMKLSTVFFVYKEALKKIKQKL